MTNNQPNNPFQNITLKMILTDLVDICGWEELGEKINIKCFNQNPSISSSLKFLRRTPWARKKVEDFWAYKKFEEKRKT
ncbi:VF530 family DNA-binding protein [Candidatus Margulisiibacteriota bacterium]